MDQNNNKEIMKVNRLEAYTKYLTNLGYPMARYDSSSSFSEHWWKTYYRTDCGWVGGTTKVQVQKM
jgi:hypothetical protein